MSFRLHKQTKELSNIMEGCRTRNMHPSGIGKNSRTTKVIQYRKEVIVSAKKCEAKKESKKDEKEVVKRGMKTALDVIK